MIRKQILEQAINLTTRDRAKTYGPPQVNLQCLADLINAYLKAQGKEGALDAKDAAMLMVLTKASRVAVNANHDDNYIDGAAYFAIAGECANLKQKAPPEPKKTGETYHWNKASMTIDKGRINIGGTTIEE